MDPQPHSTRFRGSLYSHGPAGSAAGSGYVAAGSGHAARVVAPARRRLSLLWGRRAQTDRKGPAGKFGGWSLGFFGVLRHFCGGSGLPCSSPLSGERARAGTKSEKKRWRPIPTIPIPTGQCHHPNHHHHYHQIEAAVGAAAATVMIPPLIMRAELAESKIECSVATSHDPLLEALWFVTPAWTQRHFPGGAARRSGTGTRRNRRPAGFDGWKEKSAGYCENQW